MITICLDTNAFQDNWLVNGEAFTFLRDLVAKGEAAVYVSEVTIKEHVRHYSQKRHALESNLKSSLSIYAKLVGKKNPKALVFPDPQSFEKRFRKRLEYLGFEVLPIPNDPHEELLQRDLAEKKPFNASGKGYRDSLIWLSFLHAVDHDTTQVVVVTSNHKDFCVGESENLHSDLLSDIKAQNSSCSACRYASPQKLVDEFVKPLLKKLADETQDAKLEKLLRKIATNKIKALDLEEILRLGVADFEAQEMGSGFYAGSFPLEDPIYATSLDEPSDIELDTIYQLEDGNCVCEGTAAVLATVEGFLDHFEAMSQEEAGIVHVTNPTWNDHYSEVELSGAPAEIRFSFEFDPDSFDVIQFEVTDLKSAQTM